MFRFFAGLAAALVLSACTDINDLSKKPTPIGEFALGHNVVVAPNLVKGPASRDASKDEWIAAVTKAMDARFNRFDGDQLYHFGISLEGYVLAQPGVPLVLAPKSVLIMKLTVWDDATGKKLNSEPEQITVLENLDGNSIVGSGLTKTSEEQMQALAENAAKLVQRFLIRQHRAENWFKRRPGTATAPRDAAEKAVEEQKVAVENAVPAAKNAAKPVATATSTAETEAASATATATSNN